MPKRNALFQHRLVEGAEDLLQGVEAGEVDQNQRAVAEETRVEGFTTDISGRVAGSDKLNSL